ncbi:MAG: hypothetical protein A3E98_03745 [Candidatus Doudnabacteria bacterium RIFCSPHIGHO2_12_FULL_48_11]|uniref:CDP-archaeol synthase n=1 Tax=Candidatus Doudnabacteria bacterium RIFCSPHIGHO2_01_FULL_46_24 TaxID=1817825 RepID=A0A1F5NTX3_9BACT|nr:MAG: hypothetical protein A2720_03735 [Candidatus Doudnabacteria bacterium RIFCSPHIGHO2_01_FULL_46_24]OGE95860.1 MAG: hypothetical protein A3E98_03745 [Candidatus Doudnabacteria bacterium RIFCSPHIGHO2_12_FULL_48_11]
MSILDNIIFAFWFFLPAGLANMFPIFAAHAPVLRRWDYPLDCNRTFRNRRIFGAHKTWRGLIVGILIGALTALVQSQPMMLGVLLGLGAVLGDAAKSFFKRQRDIPSGESWPIFDQLDYILGGIALSFWYWPLGAEQYLLVIAVYFVLHLLTSAIGYLLGLKQKII